jgi:glycosyltransferase involved in cell wall biosynthesis
LRVPTILKVAMADSDLAFDRQGRINGSVNRWMVKKFDRYIATTRAIAAEMRSVGLEAARICLIPNGVDTATFAPVGEGRRAELRRELALPDGPIVSCVAIVNERKNIDGTLRMWRDVVARGLPGHLLLIGPVQDPDGPFYRGLRGFVDQHGLASRVRFLGKRDPVAPYLQVSDAFLFPSRQEGMPNSVLEAMSCGVPCVVSRSAGTEEIVTHGHDGFTLDPDDERAFADAIARLIEDRPLRESLSTAARQTVASRFSLNSVAGRYVRLYAELLGKGEVSPILTSS